jgi:hypothetical protein
MKETNKAIVPTKRESHESHIKTRTIDSVTIVNGALTYSNPCSPVNKIAKIKVNIKATNVCRFALANKA